VRNEKDHLQKILIQSDKVYHPGVLVSLLISSYSKGNSFAFGCIENHFEPHFISQRFVGGGTQTASLPECLVDRKSKRAFCIVVTMTEE
jgi:hypothetical protein